jgi:hypothetical protein
MFKFGGIHVTEKSEEEQKEQAILAFGPAYIRWQDIDAAIAHSSKSPKDLVDE